MATLAVTFSYETVDDLMTHVGNVPGRRVRLSPVPGSATEQDAQAIARSDNLLCELVDGVLVAKAMSFYEARVAAVLIYLLEIFANDQRLGMVVGPDAMLRLAPGLVRIPDVSFIARSKLPGGKAPREPIVDLVPDLVVEILSDANTSEEMARKRREYFEAGVQILWLVEPTLRQVSVFTKDDPLNIQREGQSLDGGAVLPGFTLSIQDWFDQVDLAERE